MHHTVKTKTVELKQHVQPKPKQSNPNGSLDLKYPVYFQMSSFPPADWEVRYLQDMDTFTVEPDGHKLCLAALLAVKPAGAMEENFRLTLTGTEDVSIRLNVADFIPHKAMEAFTVVGQFHPGEQIQMLPNSTTSGWVDFK
jgi:hypothetical protein